MLPALVGLMAQAALAQDLAPLPRWQARVQLGSADAPDAPRGSRLLSANLLGDYYLTGSARSGLRATGGMLLGPLSVVQSASALTLGQSGPLSVGQRAYALASLNGLEGSSSLSYLGLGYTGHWTGIGLSFSADLGLMSGIPGSYRLGRSSAQGFEDVMRDLRFKPLLQLGLSYAY
jgi:hypothetical protein